MTTVICVSLLKSSVGLQIPVVQQNARNKLINSFPNWFYNRIDLEWGYCLSPFFGCPVINEVCFFGPLKDFNQILWKNKVPSDIAMESPKHGEK